VVHQSVSRGFAVFADAWLSGWLAEISADLRENGSALEVVLHEYALYKSTFTLLYLLYSNTVICTLAVDGWAVTFGTAMRGRSVTVHLSTANVLTSYYSMWHWTLKG